jgi:4-amino-4-deoxy-L-arabinose transferase-like glycosyltransferase
MGKRTLRPNYSTILQRIGRLARGRIVSCLIVAMVAVCGLYFRLHGLRRSLWLDEAWVANSVIAESLRGMFRYDSWLQTSPPLFLLLVRVTVGFLGLTPFAFRLIPFLFGLLSCVCMFYLARQVLSPRWVLPAWTLFVLSPAAIYYSQSLKQYSLELAVATAVFLTCILYLQRPTARRFWLLLAVVAAGLLMSYSVVFLLPGIILVVCLVENKNETSVTVPRTRKWTGLMRSFILAAVAGAILVGLYLFFVLPNTSPSLRAFFAGDRGGGSFFRVAGSIASNLRLLFPLPYFVLSDARVPVFFVLVFVLFIGLILAWLKFRGGSRRWLEVQVICAVPLLLQVICDGLTWYPMTARTSLFLLPALILLFMCDLELILDLALRRLRREWIEPLMDTMLVCAMLMVVFAGLAKRPLAALLSGDEDVAAAVSYLHSNVQRGDILWVHTTCSESFKLYRRMTKWEDAPARFGHTGWPCCPRGISVVKGASKEENVRRDLNNGVPTSFSGKVWLLYTMRTYQWKWVGVDEPRIMEDVFRERGCIQESAPVFNNIGVSSFDCRSSRSNP